MNKAKINAIIASSYNIFFGQKENHVMTPAEAAKLPRGDRAALLQVLSRKGGSDLYSKADADAAFAQVVS